MERKNYIIIVLAVILLAGCFEEYKPKYGVEYNDTRKKYHIPILENDWEVHSVGENYTHYKNPKSDSLKNLLIPHHSGKSVVYYDGELKKEVDVYIGKKRFNIIDGTIKETLSICYMYKLHPLIAEKKIGWNVNYYAMEPIETELGTFCSIDSLTIEYAEAILKAWGIERLNY